MELRAQLIYPGVPCGLCGRPIDTPRLAHLDHITPRSAGGTNAPSNLTPTHARCNMSKGPGYVRPSSPPAIIAMPRPRP